MSATKIAIIQKSEFYLQPHVLPWVRWTSSKATNPIWSGVLIPSIQIWKTKVIIAIFNSRIVDNKLGLGHPNCLRSIQCSLASSWIGNRICLSISGNKKVPKNLETANNWLVKDHLKVTLHGRICKASIAQQCWNNNVATMLQRWFVLNIWDVNSTRTTESPKFSYMIVEKATYGSAHDISSLRGRRHVPGARCVRWCKKFQLAFSKFPQSSMCLNPLTPRSDRHLTSPNNINSLSSRKVIRIGKCSSQRMHFWYKSKFSKLRTKYNEIYSSWKGELQIRSWE